MRKLVFIPLVLAVSYASAQAPFSRVYKVGVTQTYTITQSVQLMGTHTMSVDVSLTPVKLLDGGKAQVKVHWSNFKKDTDDTTKMPEDFTVQLGSNGLPYGLKPEQGDISYLVAMLGMAGATTDKPAAVGQEAQITWDPGDNSMVLKGVVKVLEILPDKKQLKTVVNIKPSFGGQEAGEMVFNSLIDTTDYALVSSSGTFSLGKQEFTFTRKKA